METSQNGLELIKKHEGLKLKAYLCPANVWTIGYGHTRTARQGMVISEQQAEDLLKSDLDISEKVVKHSGNYNQNQFDALVSFVFNVGSGAFKSSTLLKKIKAGAPESEIRHQFSRWNKANGKELAGLTKRRQDEADLYFS